MARLIKRDYSTDIPPGTRSKSNLGLFFTVITQIMTISGPGTAGDVVLPYLGLDNNRNCGCTALLLCSLCNVSGRHIKKS